MSRSRSGGADDEGHRTVGVYTRVRTTATSSGPATLPARCHGLRALAPVPGVKRPRRRGCIELASGRGTRRGRDAADASACTRCFWKPRLVRPGAPVCPRSRRGVTLHATGAAAVRIRVTPAESGSDASRLDIFEAGGEGALIASVESLVLRAVAEEQLRAAGGRWW